MRKYDVEPDKIGEDKVRESAFNVPIEGADDMTPLLYQSGYLTIKDYAERFSLTGLPTVKVGVNFDTQERTISDWKIEKQ